MKSTKVPTLSETADPAVGNQMHVRGGMDGFGTPLMVIVNASYTWWIRLCVGIA